MANLFTESMDEDFNDDRIEARKLADSFHRDVLLWYDNLYASIIVELINIRTSKGYYSRQARWAAYKRITRLIDAMILRLGKEARYNLKRFARLVGKGIIKDLPKKPSLRKTNAIVDDVFERTYDDFTTHAKFQCERIKNQIWRTMRDEAISILSRSNIDGITRAEAQQAIISQPLDKDFGYIDNRGYRWDSKTYFDVLTRTMLIEAERSTASAVLIETGNDLARITSVPTNDECRNWIGKVVSLTGKTKGYPTLEQVKATGEIFHPRCRHSLVPYRSA